jgi:heme A synthase
MKIVHRVKSESPGIIYMGLGFYAWLARVAVIHWVIRGPYDSSGFIIGSIFVAGYVISVSLLAAVVAIKDARLSATERPMLVVVNWLIFFEAFIDMRPVIRKQGGLG